MYKILLKNTHCCVLKNDLLIVSLRKPTITTNGLYRIALVFLKYYVAFYMQA